jgi:hypothetical protein
MQTLQSKVCSVSSCVAAGVGEDMIDYVAVMNTPQQQLEEALHGR